jgi:predicted site-specific integrase-resolvase
MANHEHLLTPRAAAIGVSFATIKKWLLAGTLKSLKTPGGHHRIPESALAPLSKSSPKEKPVTKRIQSRERFRSTSGRNQLVGTVVDVKIQVILAIGDQRITAAAALMKATSVMITRV